MLKLFVFLAVASAVSAAGNVCKTGNIVNRLVNSKPFYWPATWNETQSAPRLEKEQSCSWTVTIPKGYYAKLIINGKTNDKDSRFQTVDSAGNFVQTTHEGMEPYYFPTPKFTIAVSNEAAATFAFRVEWFTLPKITMDNGVGIIDRLINATDNLYCQIYGGVGGISLLAFPEDRKHFYSLRSVLVFEGNDLDSGNYISNLFLLYQTKKQYLSQTNGVILANLEASTKNDLLLIQEGALVNNVTYTELVPELNSIYNVTVNGHNKRAALVSASYVNQTLIDVQMDNAATVSVYYGSPDPFTLDNTYNSTSFKKALPLNYPSGTTVQFFVNAGKVLFTFQA